jgi:hypothetical protein
MWLQLNITKQIHTNGLQNEHSKVTDPIKSCQLKPIAQLHYQTNAIELSLPGEHQSPSYSRISQHIKEPEDPLPCLQKPVTSPHPVRLIKSIPPHPISLITILILSSTYVFLVVSSSCLWNLNPTCISFLLNACCMLCPFQPISLIIPIISGGEYSLRST